MYMPSSQDEEILSLIRENVNQATSIVYSKHDKINTSILEVGPSSSYPINLKNAIHHTLDIKPSQSKSSINFVCDICNKNDFLTTVTDQYDVILLFEVLEHTSNPFFAIENIYSRLKDGGILYLTTPFNFRIHGPLPDNWRFTEHGLRQLLSPPWHIISIEELPTPSRALMPIHYLTIAKK